MLQLGELPAGHRRRAQVAGLARLDHVVQRFHGLGHGSLGVEPVDLVQVDVAGAEPGQGGVDLLEDGLAGQARAAGAVVHPAGYLGGQHDVLAA